MDRLPSLLECKALLVDNLRLKINKEIQEGRTYLPVQSSMHKPDIPTYVLDWLNENGYEFKENEYPVWSCIYFPHHEFK